MRSTLPGSVLTLALVAAPALAHEDDPKIADLAPAIQGTGFRAAVDGTPGGTARGGRSSNAAALGFPAQGMELMSWLTLGDLGNGADTGNDCWGYVSPSGREYALIGTSRATVVVEVTDPGNATIVARITGPTSLWRDVKVYQDRCYAVSEGGDGIQVIDLSQVDAGVVTLETTLTGQGTDATHNVAIDEDSGFLYRCGGGNSGLRIYSLQNPGAPQYVGQWNQRYVHDAQIVTYTTGPYAGRQIAFCCAGFNGGRNDTGLTILDVTNKGNIQVIGQHPYPDRAYSHQGWLSADRTRFYLGDELDQQNGVHTLTTRVFDVTDPANASFRGTFAADFPAISHNMYERGGLLFQANYTAGVNVFDVGSDPDHPREIASFDTAPDRTSASFNGCWNVYPYFPSGTIIASDLERGLFVLTLDPLTVDVVGTPPATLAETGGTLTVDIGELNPGSLDPTSPVLEMEGAGLAFSRPLTPTGTPGRYTADLSGFPCGTEVHWHVSAFTQSGIQSTFPPAAPVEPALTYAGASAVQATSYDMQADAGWTRDVAGDTAPRGLWVRSVPIGTDANPAEDHSVPGRYCWFTGQTNQLNNNDQDVDDGVTTLLSPELFVAGMEEPWLVYWRWYSTHVSGVQDDTFRVEFSTDGGATWGLVEEVGPTGPETEGGWRRASFPVRAFAPGAPSFRLRFVASDLGSPTLVEAALDDVAIVDVTCGPPLGTPYCTANPNSTGAPGEVVAAGTDQASTNSLRLLARGLPAGQFGFFLASPTQVFVPNLSGSQGNLCVGPLIGRYLDQVATAGPDGTLLLELDTTALSSASGTVPALPGDTWNFQAWHRDLNPGATSNLMVALAVTFR